MGARDELSTGTELGLLVDMNDGIVDGFAFVAMDGLAESATDGLAESVMVVEGSPDGLDVNVVEV